MDSDADTSLQLRCCVAAHAGAAGHRRKQATEKNLAKVYWASKSDDVQAFLDNCLLCIVSCSHKVPVPFSQTLHSTIPGELIHFDFLFLGTSREGYKYALLIKDDASAYCWLVPTKRADADSTARALMNWFAAFGTATLWVTDQGPHFRNEVMRVLADVLHVQHNFTPAYTPHTNGTIEVVCKQTLRALRALCTDFGLQPDQWPTMLPLAQAVLNNSPSARNGNRTPMLAFTGREATSPLDIGLTDTVVRPADYSFIRAQQAMKIQELTKSMEEIHREVARSATRKRQAAIDSHNAKTHVHANNFQVGDWVLVAVVQTQTRHKVSAVWKGPRRIVGQDPASASIYEVENVLKHTTNLVHRSHLRHYADNKRGDKEILQVAKLLEHEVFTIKKFLNLRYQEADARWEVLCAWRGYSLDESTWEPVEVIAIDTPDFFSDFLNNFEDQDIVSELRATLP